MPPVGPSPTHETMCSMCSLSGAAEQAIRQGKACGIAFQNLPSADNIGYVIPTPIIKRFLSDVAATGRHGGFCHLGARCQPTENAQMRRYLQLPPGTTGVLVNSLTPLTHAAEVLRKDDVVTAFDGVRVANDGSVSLRGRERVAFDYLVSLKRPGETAMLSVLREGKPQEIEVTLVGQKRPSALHRLRGRASVLQQRFAHLVCGFWHLHRQ